MATSVVMATRCTPAQVPDVWTLGGKHYTEYSAPNTLAQLRNAWKCVMFELADREGVAVVCSRDMTRYGHVATDDCPRVSKSVASRLMHEAMTLVFDAARQDPHGFARVMRSKAVTTAECIGFIMDGTFAERLPTLLFLVAMETEDSDSDPWTSLFQQIAALPTPQWVTTR